MLLIESLGTNFSEILIEIHIFSFKKMQLKMLSGKWRPFCLSLNVLMPHVYSSTCNHIFAILNSLTLQVLVLHIYRIRI